MAHSAWTGGSVYTGQAALPHKNIHIDGYIEEISSEESEKEISECSVPNSEKTYEVDENFDLKKYLEHLIGIEKNIMCLEQEIRNLVLRKNKYQSKKP